MFSLNLGCYRSFGLAAVLDAPQEKRCLVLVQDVSTQKSFCRRAGQAVYGKQLEPVYLKNVIEDSI